MNESNGHKYEHSTDRQLQHSIELPRGHAQQDAELVGRLATSCFQRWNGGLGLRQAGLHGLHHPPSQVFLRHCWQRSGIERVHTTSMQDTPADVKYFLL